MLTQLRRMPTGAWMLSFAFVFAFAALAWANARNWSITWWSVAPAPLATALLTAVAARLGHRSTGSLVGWTLFAPLAWALCLFPALIMLALVVGLLYGHGIK
jgi:hypothetical protein